jgi:carbon monoxide dehydrogenase subunit G
MADKLRPVGLDFLETAPTRVRHSVHIDAPAEAVFAAIAEDPAGWGKWFPGFSDDGHYLGEPPYGVGSVREVRAAGNTVLDTVIAWDVPTRWAFSATGGTLRGMRALAEDYRVSADGAGSRLTWTVAVDFAGPSRIIAPVFRLGSGVIIKRAARKLAQHLQTAPAAG